MDLKRQHMELDAKRIEIEQQRQAQLQEQMVLQNQQMQQQMSMMLALLQQNMNKHWYQHRKTKSLFPLLVTESASPRSLAPSMFDFASCLLLLWK